MTLLLETFDASPITDSDRSLFEESFAQSSSLNHYENSWAYIVQQARRGGFKTKICANLIIALIKDEKSPYMFILPPIGRGELGITEWLQVAYDYKRLLGRKPILRGVSDAIVPELIKLGGTVFDHNEYSISSDFPEDVFPQIVISSNIQERIRDEPAFQKTRNQLNYLYRSWQVSSRTWNTCARSALYGFVEAWAAERNARHDGTEKELSHHVDTTGYTAIIDHFHSAVECDKIHGRVHYVNNELAGYSFSAVTGPKICALYASISKSGIRGLAEHIIVDMAKHINDRGFDLLNLGGSEEEGLYIYKSKYLSVLEMKKYDVAVP